MKKFKEQHGSEPFETADYETEDLAEEGYECTALKNMAFELGTPTTALPTATVHKFSATTPVVNPYTKIPTTMTKQEDNK